MTILVLVIAQASPSLADVSSSQTNNEWQWRMLAGASNGSNGYSYWYTTISASPLATDNYDGEPLITSWDIPTTYAAIFHAEEPNKWDASTGFYREDYVGLLTPGQTKSWQIYVWSTPDMPADYDATYLVMNRMDNIALTNDFQFQLKLVSKPESVSGGPEVGTTWDFDIPAFEVEFPTYRTDNGLTGYHFELTATAVPEPSAFAVLACGLFGILTQTRKRRSS